MRITIWVRAMTQEQIREERNRFEAWAGAQGMKSGRDEGGYHDDDDQAKIAWRGWLAHARLVTANAAGNAT